MLYFTLYYIAFCQVHETEHGIPVVSVPCWRHELVPNSILVPISFDPKYILHLLLQVELQKT